jgi:hypothetical protein
VGRSRRTERWLGLRGALPWFAAAPLIAGLLGCGKSVVPLGADRRQQAGQAGTRAGLAGSGGTDAPESREAANPIVMPDGGGASAAGDRDSGMSEQKPALPPCELDLLIPAAGETCYDFPVHGVSSPVDASPFMIWAGELYSHFYYAVPWPSGSVATSYGVVLDEPDLTVHAWAFGIPMGEHASGTVEDAVTGTLLGQDATMIGAWARGACNVRLPPDVGLELPAAGDQVLVEWHYWNDADVARYDSSAFRICTAPAGSRSNLAGLTLLGTDNLNGITGMGPGRQRFSGRCANDSAGDITIVRVDPHMHRIGVAASAVVWRAGGNAEVVLDRPFQFGTDNDQVFEPPVVLRPGDAIEAGCTFDNTTGYHVTFGPSLIMEMCFQFAIAYPARALDNGVANLIGVNGACW